MTGHDPVRLLTTPLGVLLLGLELRADVYATNAFRLIGTSANADPGETETALQRFRNVLRLDAEAALRRCIATGYECPLPAQEASGTLGRLHDPRYRLLWELFWPHLDEQSFAPIRAERSIASDRALAHLDSKAGGNGLAGALTRHALAVVHHNRAIAGDLAFGAGKGRWSDDHWRQAIDHWSHVVEADVFWGYMTERAAALDDPRVGAADVQSARRQLPAVLLAWNALFARSFAREAADVGRGHLKLIQGAGFDATAKKEALATTVKTLAATRLDPLVQKVQAFVESPGRGTRQAFVKQVEPALAEATAARDQLVEELGLPEDVVEQSEFDRFAEVVLNGLNRKIDYDTDDRVRALLYSLVTTQRMLALPLSTAMRRKLEGGVRSDTEYLYKDVMPKAGSFDHTRCWFMEGERPDPDESIELPVYKIAEVKGDSVQWRSRKVLVPRSRRARLVHDGKLKLEDVPEEKLDAEGRALAQQIRDEQKALDQKLRTHDEKHTADKAQAEAELEDIRRRRDERLAEENKRLKRAVADKRAEGERHLRVFERRHREVVEQYGGWQGAWRIELVSIGIWAALSFGVALLFGWKAVGSMLCPAMGAFWGLAMARGYRQTQVETSEKALKAERDKADDAVEVVEKTGKKKKADLEMEFTKEGAKAHDRLEKIEEGRRKIEKPAAETIDKLQHRLTDRIRGKPEKAKWDYPPYKKAMSDGFKDGVKPSDSEVSALIKRQLDEMMASLDPIAKMVLMKAAQELPGAKFNELLGTLLGMSSYERNRKLRSIVGM